MVSVLLIFAMGCFDDHYIGCVLEFVTASPITKYIKYFWRGGNLNVNAVQQPETLLELTLLRRPFLRLQ